MKFLLVTWLLTCGAIGCGNDVSCGDHNGLGECSCGDGNDLGGCQHTETTDIGLPVLNTIYEKTFLFPYSCEPVSNNVPQYEGAALFLSTYSESINNPELLYNGACKSGNYFEGSTAGDDFALLTDVGDVPLETLTASKSLNYDNVVGHDNDFYANVDVVQDHSYAALISDSNVRAFFVFRVDSYTPDGEAIIRYAVKQYGVVRCVEESDGFGWVTDNQ